MMGIDPRAARATCDGDSDRAALPGGFTPIRNTVFVFIVSLLFAYLLLRWWDFSTVFFPMPRSRTPALAIGLPRAVTGIVVPDQCRNSSRLQANNLAQRITIS